MGISFRHPMSPLDYLIVNWKRRIGPGFMMSFVFRGRRFQVLTPALACDFPAKGSFTR
jgi:hypothetical protein